MNNRRNDENDEEDDDDYMSDKILNKIADKRPGLLTKSQIRQANVEKKHFEHLEINKEKHQSLNKLEEQKRNEALAKSILETDENSKGLSLMKKMGFKIGMSLGKSTSSGAIKEPIDVKLKVNREGLGLDEEKKRKCVEYEEKIKKFKTDFDEMSERNFINNKKIQVEFRRIKAIFYKTQRICYQFDLSQKFDRPILKWYWPSNTQKKETKADENLDDEEIESQKKIQESNIEDIDEDSDEEKYGFEEIKDKLHQLNLYLRESYLYCIWCAIKYKNINDLTTNCPGLAEDDHDV